MPAGNLACYPGTKVPAPPAHCMLSQAWQGWAVTVTGSVSTTDNPFTSEKAKEEKEEKKHAQLS